MPVGVLPALDALTLAVSVRLEPCAMFEAEAERVVVVMAALAAAPVTVTLTALDVDALKVPVPVYVAVMESLPTGKADVVKVATPPESVAFPSAAPSL